MPLIGLALILLSTVGAFYDWPGLVYRIWLDSEWLES